MDTSKAHHQSTVASELYFLIAKFLAAGPCIQAAEVLRRELEKIKILPKRLDWLGNEHEQTFEELERKYPHVSPNHLMLMCQRIGPILDKELKPSVSGIQSLLGAGNQSLLRTQEDLRKQRRGIVYYAARNNGQPLLNSPEEAQHNLVQVLQGREFTGSLSRIQIVNPKFYNKLQLYCRTLGHLSAVYCLLFDRTGKYVITGADDLLVKIWSTDDGRLLATLRGASAEITDIAVSLENTLLAAGSCDKIIRVWCLETTAPIAVLTGHTGMITAVHFCPSYQGHEGFLVSTSTDGSVAFWTYERPHATNKVSFQPKPIQFHERMRPGQAQMICASFSQGGNFLAAGSADHHVRVYLMHGEEGPERILEKEAHSDRVDSIQWANKGLQFISGSKDGTAHVWRFERQEWKSLQLTMTTKLPGASDKSTESKAKLKVSMVGWDLSDEWVITAVTDLTLKVWNSQTGSLQQILRGHKDEVFVLESHPSIQHLLLSAGHDGQIIMWDILGGTIVKTFQNFIEGQGNGAVFDAKWSPDGTMVAATDSHGHILMFGLGSNEKFRKLPSELFFHTDYRPLIRDANQYVLDEQTQTAPHIMPPPFLVDIDGNPYPPNLQRLVPGRENCQEEQLIPNIVVGAGGEQEVIEGLPGNEDGRAQPRSNIDQMIAQLALQHRERIQNVNRSLSLEQNIQRNERYGQSSQSGRQGIRNRGDVPRVGMRRSGDVEGVRQSSGNWQRDNSICWGKRVLIHCFNLEVLRSLHEKRMALGDIEMEIYEREKRRQRETPILNVTPETRPGRRHRQLRNQQQHGYGTRAANVDHERHLDSEFENPDNLDLSGSSESSSNESSAANGELASSSSDSESSEYSDWIADAGVNLEPPKRSRRRPVRRVPTPVSEDDDNEDDDDDEEEEDRESENKQEKKRTTVREKKIETTQETKVTKPALTEVPELYRPSEWLSEVIPRKAPYYPQMGDEVVYFRQGHQLYFNAVRNKQVFEVGPRSEPWSRRHIREHELVKIIGIKYEIRPPRLCCLKFGLIDPGSRKYTGESFTIKYHDMADVLDFLVLRQTYETAVTRNWRPGNRFRCMIDDCWWMGVIESQAPYDIEFPDSMFLCYTVRWDNGEYERMSPWDLEPINENRLPEEVGGGVQVLPEEIQATLYRPRADEWPYGDRDSECERISAGFEQVMSLAIAEPFVAPVDLNLYPSYAMVVEYPIDLSTIKARLDNRFYRRVASVQFDVRYIATNAEKFNEPGSQIVKQARIVCDLCLRIIKDRHCVDATAVYHQLVENYKSSESDNEPETSKRKVARPNVRLKPQPVDSSCWKRQCRELLEMLWQCEDSEPFREPVDRMEHPDYYEVIDTPMDLRTIKEDLLGDNYSSPIDFCKDMRLIFQNSRNYNTNKRSRIYSMTIRLSAMFEEHMKKILFDWKAARRKDLDRLKAMKQNNTSQVKSLGTSSQAKSTRGVKTLKTVNGPSTSKVKPVRVNNNESSVEVVPRRRQAALISSQKIRLGNSQVANGHVPSVPVRSTRTRVTRSSYLKKLPKRKVQSSGGSNSSRSNSVSSNRSSRSNSSSSSDSDSDSEAGSAGSSNSSSDKANASASSDKQGKYTRAHTKVSASEQVARRYRRVEETDEESEASHGDSEMEDRTSLHSRRTRQAAREKPANVSVRTSGRVPKRRRLSESEESYNPTVEPGPSRKRSSTSMQTRNRGKQKINYHEDSDYEPEEREINLRTREKRKHYSEESDFDVDDSDDNRTIISISSRGRIRKLTARAKALLRD